jgi:hypothetical protein
MPTIYEAAGGRDGLLRLASAWHTRVLEDEVVSHAFSHGYHPQHTERLAAYWAEALGGPAAWALVYCKESQGAIPATQPILSLPPFARFRPASRMPTGRGQNGLDELRREISERSEPTPYSGSRSIGSTKFSNSISSSLKRAVWGNKCSTHYLGSGHHPVRSAKILEFFSEPLLANLPSSQRRGRGM